MEVSMIATMTMGIANENSLAFNFSQPFCIFG